MRIETLSERPLVRLAVIDRDDVRWSYDAKPPSWRGSPALEGNYGRGDEIDPWGPCYTHDENLVGSLLLECAAAAPLACAPVTLYLSCYEGLSRTNGWSCWDHPYCRDGTPEWWHGPGEKPWEGVIALNGKRIEIHPAITRYVVAHEYGHLVDAALALHRYPGDGGAFGKLHDDYARLRRLDRVSHYGAGTHHLDVGEVLANDFRTVVLGRERDFWAHPVTPGWKLKRVQAWWDQALADLRAVTKAAA